MSLLAPTGPCGRKAARALFFLAALGCGGASLREGEVVLAEGSFAVGLSGKQASEAAAFSPDRLARVLSVHVKGRPENALFGDHRVEGRRLVFAPRYPLRPGLSYTAVFRPGELGARMGVEYEIVESFAVPVKPSGPPTTVVRVAPSRDVLPENQLKFYLYFSAPMSRGEAYSRVRLQANGKEVEHPFLELGEELWDHAGTRLTLFFDPGRIKRELKPREDIGPSLVEGKSYVLTVDREWPDAEGRPLERDYRKSFRAAGPDEKQPDLARWTITPPRAGSRDPLTVMFDEPLDHAMLGRVLEAVDPAGAALAGRVEIDAEETRWRFHPEKPWSSGRHGLRVDTLLEDLAGNSIAKPFEVDVFRPIERKVVSKFVTLHFGVR